MVGLASRGERGTTAEPWSCHDEGVLYTMGLQWAEKVTPCDGIRNVGATYEIEWRPNPEAKFGVQARPR